MSFNVLRVDHIGIAVKNLDEAKKLYTDALGLKVHGEDEVVEEQKVKVCFIPTGDSEIELLESTAPDGPIAKHIEKNGEGIQHVALYVDNLEAALAELKEKGVRLIDETPRYGAGGKKIAFIHPKSTGGVLLELCQNR
jgi:methylmalonyl-CoA epimerase